MTKLAQGLLDLHSRAGAVDLRFLAEITAAAGAPAALAARIGQAASAAEALEIAGTSGVAVATLIAEAAQRRAAAVLAGADVALSVAVFDREGRLLAEADPPARGGAAGTPHSRDSPV